MKPPLVTPNPRPVSIKSATPAVLQAAFSDNQWTNAANLAKQRHRATKDPYYLAVETAAKSQSDNVADRSAGKVAVESMVKDNTTVTDIDTLDMYELACSRLDMKYSETIGLLRARLVKAIPKDMNSCTRCFDACVYHSDWKNAQQIAASLNKNFASDRQFLFQYILATHQYALSEDCPEGSRRIFAQLTKAQADKAFNLHVATASQGHHNRASLTESEAWLWLIIRITHCGREENLELFRKPERGPLAFLEAGLLGPYKEAMDYLQKEEAWDDLFLIGKRILEEVICICQAEALAIEEDERVIDLRKLASAEIEQGTPPKESSAKKDLARAIGKARPRRSLKDHAFLDASCEWYLFKAFYDAARKHPDRKRRLREAHQLFAKTMEALAKAESMKPIFQRSYDLITLKILFERDSQLVPRSEGSTLRVIHLTNHMVEHYKEPGCFKDAQELFKGMSKLEIITFLNSLRIRGIKCVNIFQRLTLMSLAFKLRYYVMANSRFTCEFCDAVLDGSICTSCLKSIATNALDAYKSGMEDDNLRQNILPGEVVDPLSEIAVVGAVCLLRLAGLGYWVSTKDTNSPLYSVNMQLFLQAVLWLDSHVMATPPKNDMHRMLLVKLYLLMGCVTRARALWDGFDVKNAIIDSLGLLFVDRLSSVAPGTFILGSSYDNPVDPFITHYTRSLKNTTPKWIMGSLEVGSFSSLLDMTKSLTTQNTSCALVMSVVEERRGLRMKTGKVETSIEDEPIVRKLSVEHELHDPTDYGILSTLADGDLEPVDSGTSKPIHAIVNYGPLPSHTRAHLGLLAERFLDFICYAQPKEYKPSKAGQVIQLDLQYAFATCSHLQKDMQTLLGIADSKLSEEEKKAFSRQQEMALASLTSPEIWYYRIVWRLAEVVKNVLGLKTNPAPASEVRDYIRVHTKEVTENLGEQTTNFLAVPNSFQSELHGFHGFGALHAMGMLRESALAVKHTVNYLTVTAEKVKNVDKTRSSSASDLAWLAPELKKMAAAAAESENTIKARIKMLKGFVGDADGLQDRLCEWTFGDHTAAHEHDKEFKQEVREKLQGIVPKTDAEGWADQVGDSWRELIRGWAAVKFD